MQVASTCTTSATASNDIDELLEIWERDVDSLGMQQVFVATMLPTMISPNNGGGVSSGGLHSSNVSFSLILSQKNTKNNCNVSIYYDDFKMIHVLRPRKHEIIASLNRSNLLL